MTTLSTANPVGERPKQWGRPFKKGQSGNPSGGRKTTPVNVVELCRKNTTDAVNTWLRIMKDDKASFAVRAYCATQIVDRAYGKAPQQTNLQISSNIRKASELTDDELMAIIDAQRQPPKIIEGSVIPGDDEPASALTAPAAQAAETQQTRAGARATDAGALAAGLGDDAALLRED